MALEEITVDGRKVQVTISNSDKFGNDIAFSNGPDNVITLLVQVNGYDTLEIRAGYNDNTRQPLNVGLPLAGIKKSRSEAARWDVLWSAKFGEPVPVVSYEISSEMIIFGVGSIDAHTTETYIAFDSRRGEMIGQYSTREEVVKPLHPMVARL